MPLELAVPLVLACLGAIGVVWRWGAKKDDQLQECMEARLDDLQDRVAHHEQTAAAIAKVRKGNEGADEET